MKLQVLANGGQDARASRAREFDAGESAVDYQIVPRCCLSTQQRLDKGAVGVDDRVAFYRQKDYLLR